MMWISGYKYSAYARVSFHVMTEAFSRPSRRHDDMLFNESDNFSGRGACGTRSQLAERTIFVDRLINDIGSAQFR